MRTVTEHGCDDRPVELNLTLLYHDPLGERTRLRWPITERLLLTLALGCLGGFVLVWVGWW